MSEATVTTNYETETCSRCGGSGHYSYNQISGTRCFKCGGAGKTLTKRGKAALAFANEMLDKRVEEVPEGAVVRFHDAFRGKIYRNCTVTKSDRTPFLNRDGTPAPSFYIRSSKGEVLCHAGEGIEVRLHPTREQVEAVNAYQDSLTKAGTVSKRAAK